MAHIQSILKILCLSVLCLLPGLVTGQTGTEPRQIEAVDTLSTGVELPTYEDWIMKSKLDTIGITDYRYHHARLALNHLFVKEDSVCFSLIHQEDTTCVPLDSLGCFTVIYGNGDSTRVICAGDTMFVTYPEPGMGGSPGDTTYYWPYSTDGGAPDTVTMGELINFVSGTNINITQGSTNLTFDVPNMRDTCRHTLTQLTDSTAQLTDCLGNDRGTVEFAADQCIQSMLVSNGVPDTVFITYCDGTTPKDTLLIWPAAFNDSYIESAGVWTDDTVMLYRIDTSGIIDSFPIVIPQGSINDTIYQAFTIDTTTGLFTLSDDPTASPDLLVLPFKDAIRDDYSANYTDSIKHNGYININSDDAPLYPLDVHSSDAFNTIQAIFRNDQAGVSSIRLERSSGVAFDWQNWNYGFEIRDEGNNTLLRIDTATMGRVNYIWLSDAGYLYVADYGQGYHRDTDNWSYLAAFADGPGGKVLEVPLSEIVDSLGALIDTDSQSLAFDTGTRELTITRGNTVEIPDSVRPEDADWYKWATTDVPYNILDNIYTNGKAYVGDGVNSSIYQFQILADGNNYTFRTATDQTYSQWAHEIEDDTANFVYWISSAQSNASRRDWRMVNNTPGESGVYLSLKEGYTSITKPALIVKSDGDISLGQYREDRTDGTQSDVTRMFYVSNDTLDGSELVGTLKLATVDTLKRVFADYDFIKLHNDTIVGNVDTLLPLDIADLSELLWRPGRIRLYDTIIPYQYDTLTNKILKLDPAQIQIPGRFNALDFYQTDSVTSWARIEKADMWDRITNHGVRIDSIAAWREWGATSKYKLPGETSFDITSRTFFRVSNQANENAFILHQDSIQLADYSSSREDTLVQVSEITKLFVPKANGTLALVSLDSINAALSIASSSPDLLYWDFKGDSLGILWSGLADTGFVDLSKYGVTITGDSIYQGDSVYALPQGADSLGRNGTAGQIVFETNTKAPNSSSSLFWDNSNKWLGIGTSSPNLLVDARSTTTSALIKLTNSASGYGGTDGTYVGSGPTDGYLWNYESGSLYLGTNNSLALRLMPTGQIIFDKYVSSASFPGADVGILGFATSGLVTTLDAGDLSTFIGFTGTPDGSETVVTGTNVSVTGTGTTGDPYVISDTSTTTVDGSETIVTGTGLIGVTGAGTVGSPYVVSTLADQYVNWGLQRNGGGANAIFSGSNVNFTGGGLVTIAGSGSTVTPTVTEESVEDVIGNMVTGNTETGISVGYDDATGKLNFIVSGGGTSWDLTTNGTGSTTITSTGLDMQTDPDNMIVPTKFGTVGGIPQYDFRINNGSITESKIAITNAGTDGYFLRYNTGGTMTWAVSSGGSADKLGTNFPSGEFVYGNGAASGTSSANIKASTGTSNGIQLNSTSGSGDTYLDLGNSGDNNNTYRVYRTAAGNFAIGYSSAYPFSSTTSPFVIEGGAIQNNQLRIDNSGVGIGGVSAPSAMLEVDGSALIGDNTSDQLLISNTTTYAQINHEDNTATSYIRMYDATGLGCCPRMTEIVNTAGPIRLNGTATYISTALGAGVSSGSLGIYELYVSGDQFSSTAATFTTSDSTVKKDITYLENSYDYINRLRPVSYHYKGDYLASNNLDEDKLMKGFLAQEYANVFPEDVTVGPNDKLAMNDQAVVPYTVAAVQQLIREKEQMQRTIDDLRAVAVSHEDRILKLEKMMKK